MIVVTHEMGFAREVADRILFMDGGVILADATPEEFFTKQENPRIQSFLSKVSHKQIHISRNEIEPLIPDSNFNSSSIECILIGVC